MNIIKLYGGLGNQMFQYAFGKNLQLNRGLDVMYDTTWFSKAMNPSRPYGLNKFKTIVPVCPFIATNRTIHESKDDHYNYIPNYTNKTEINFAGYWQHMEYIKSILFLLRDEFRLHPSYHTERYTDLKEEILGMPSIGMHVRRGDYITIAGHYVLPREYYENALSRVKGRVFIFSDDVAWCRDNFPGVTIVNEVDYLAFSLLRLCKSKIIANSTFSWWAAILNDNIDDTVIAPRKWRMNEEEQRRMEEGHFCPDNWIQI